MSTYVDSDGDKHHRQEYLGAEIRVRTWKRPISGTHRSCEIRMPDGTTRRGLVENYDAHALGRYLSVAKILDHARWTVREWKKNQEEEAHGSPSVEGKETDRHLPAGAPS